MSVHDTDMNWLWNDILINGPRTRSLPDEWLHPTPLPFIKPRIDIEYSTKPKYYHTCGTCKYNGVPEKDVPCVNCIHSTDMRKDLWQPKGGRL